MSVTIRSSLCVVSPLLCVRGACTYMYAYMDHVCVHVCTQALLNFPLFPTRVILIGNLEYMAMCYTTTVQHQYLVG